MITLFCTCDGRRRSSEDWVRRYCKPSPRRHNHMISFFATSHIPHLLQSLASIKHLHEALVAQGGGDGLAVVGGRKLLHVVPGYGGLRGGSAVLRGRLGTSGAREHEVIFTTTLEVKVGGGGGGSGQWRKRAAKCLASRCIDAAIYCIPRRILFPARSAVRDSLAWGRGALTSFAAPMAACSALLAYGVRCDSLACTTEAVLTGRGMACTTRPKSREGGTGGCIDGELETAPSPISVCQRRAHLHLGCEGLELRECALLLLNQGLELGHLRLVLLASFERGCTRSVAHKLGILCIDTTSAARFLT